MTDTPTKLADVIVPELFNPYYVEQSTKVNAFWRSGIVASVPDLSIGGKGGAQIQMPFWQDMDEDAQLLDDTTDLEIKKIETEQDVAVLHTRALVYGATDIAKALSGSDPMQVIGNGVGQNWSNVFNKQLIATLKGAAGSLLAESPDVNSLDISGLSGSAAYFDADSFIDAGQTLGDAKVKITGMLMHSAVEAWLRKNGEILDTVLQGESGTVETLSTYQGKLVIVDDANTASAGVYQTFLFGAGAIGYAETPAPVPSETFRQPLAGGGQDALITRRHFVLHPRGIKWTPGSGVPAARSPSDAELATTTNWTRVWDPKNVRIVLFKHKVG